MRTRHERQMGEMGFASVTAQQCAAADATARRLCISGNTFIIQVTYKLWR